MKKLILFISLIYLYSYTKLKVTKYAIRNEKIKKNMRIVLLADLHSVSFGKNQQLLLNNIERQSPDIIIMSGDMVDDRFDNTRSYQVMSDLAKKYKCFYVTGNHEYKTKHAEEIKDTLKSFGIHVLDGRGVKLPGNIFVFGVDDSNVGEVEFKRQYNRINHLSDNSGYNILIQHKPEFLKKFERSNFDLMLCGHTHGGQVVFPIFKSAVYASGQGFLPKYFDGMHNFKGKHLIISRGLTRNTRGIPRVCNPNELVVINLKKDTGKL